MRKFTTIIFIFFATICFAQKEKIKTVKVKGEFSVIMKDSDVSGKVATEKARDDAKRKAIEEICGFKVNIWEQLELSSSGESFNSLSLFQTEGEIIEFNIIREGNTQSKVREEETIFYCEAEVKVKKGTEPDPNFFARIDGLKKSYLNGENITFTILPYRDCYVKIFLFEDLNTGYRLFPNDVEKPSLFIANEKISFPTNSLLDYTITKNSSTEFEMNRIVFVFTKEERPFYHQTSKREEIDSWIAMIPNDKKFVYYTSITIK
jgi:hypothetical protein